ncbi:alanine racemase [Nicoliella spurrieriana]|uniref:Alanine racemase n=1 Tax=Nicoliella spurrieriana TaxID=2925830 RepID=A0A976RSM8_9LACO|nr:alanine racemase [Nicoliella spurrieriana]UQS87054.1 alanine racemase [Nicoliella spurrieriana]
MITGVHRNAKLVINKQALYHNINSESSRLDAGTELFMVVKADGYGHGAVQVAKVAKAAGATGFCVAILDEALELREAGLMEPILVLGVIRPKDALIAATYNISTTLPSNEWLQATVAELAHHPDASKLNVHIALDTGMGRIGFQTVASMKTALALAASNEQLINIEGVFTHFSTADSNQIEATNYFHTQVGRFNQFMAALPTRPRYVHVSNSATSLWHQECNGNMIRFGVAGYGLNPSGTEVKPPYELQPALSLETEVVHCKLVPAGRSIGYGATYTTTKDEWIATLPIGYADGYVRALHDFHVLVDGQFCPIVGRICMDQFMIKLPKQVGIGTKVTLIGKNGQNEISLESIAEKCGTIHYEVACLFQNRLPRVYI